MKYLKEGKECIISINESASYNVDHQLEANFLDRQHSHEVGVRYPASTPHRPRKSQFLADSLNESKEYWLGQVEKNAGALSNELRIYLVAEIHRLFDIDDWEEGDVPPTQNSIQAFMKLLIGLNPGNFPSIYFDYDGRVGMDWSKGNDMADFRCFSRNWIRCYISIQKGSERFRLDRNDTLSKIIKETTKLSILYKNLLAK